MPQKSLAMILLATCVASGQEPAAEKAEFRMGLDEQSQASRVEYAAVRYARVQLMMYGTDEFRESPLHFWLSLKTDNRASVYDDKYEPTALLVALSRLSGKSEKEIVKLLKEDIRRSEEARGMEKSIRGLQARIDARNGVATRVQIEECQAKADAALLRVRELKIERTKFRDSRAMYGRLAALRVNANPSTAEQRELANLEKALPHLSTQDAKDYAQYMERMSLNNDNFIVESICEFFFEQLQSSFLADKLKPLSYDEWVADAKDRGELDRLIKKQTALAKALTAGDLVTAQGPARDAFFLEWSALLAAERSPQIYNFESDSGDITITAVTMPGEIGVDGAKARIALLGEDGIRITSPDVKAFRRVEPDWPASLKAFRDGRDVVYQSKAEWVPEIVMPFSPKSSGAGLVLYLSDEAEVDLRQLKTRGYFINAYGAGRFVFSETAGRTTNRLRVFPRTGGLQISPTVLSVPASIKLTANKDVFVSKSNFVLRLDCEVSAFLESDSKDNIDIELRDASGKTRTFPAVRRGRPLFDDAQALIDRLEAERKTLTGR